jgi:4-hydroxybenzoate polyprenyltransferase
VCGGACAVEQDKKDDIMVGVKSTALLFGDKTKRWLSGFAAGSVSGLALAGYGAGMGLPYFAAVAAAGTHLAWQVGTVDIHDPADCGRKFAASKWLGAIVFAGIELSNFLAVM